MKNIKKTIFAAFVLFVSTSSIVSCTNESETQIKEENSLLQARENSIDLATAAAMYRDMTLTVEYINYKQSMQQLLDKMNANAVTFSSKNEWITWLETNLNKTLFVNVEEFSEMFDLVVENRNKMVTANTILYDFLAVCDIRDLGIVLLPEHSNPPIQTTFGVCYNGCMDNNVTTSNENWDNLMNALGGAREQGGFLGIIMTSLA